MRKRRPYPEAVVPSFPRELLAEAKTQPGAWVYAIDPAYAPGGADGAVPPEGIIGAWKIADDGSPTGEFQANPRYGSNPSTQD
jgi:hypothetical protein